jgi:hypothetical protein
MAETAAIAAPLGFHGACRIHRQWHLRAADGVEVVSIAKVSRHSATARPPIGPAMSS